MPSFDVRWTATLKANQFDQDDFLMASAPQSTDKLEISGSIYSLYCYGTWTFTNTRALLESGRLAVGNIIHFDFFPDDGNIYGYDLGILSFRNGPGSDSTYLGETYEITLVSPWYFDQVIRSKAYTGGSSAIIAQLVKEELANSFAKATMITTTQDNTLTVRYRTNQTPGRFIEDRLQANFLGTNNTTTFIYTNLKNELELIDPVFIANEQGYTAISLKSPNLSTYQGALANSVLSTFFIYPHAMIFNVNNGPSKQLWHLTSPGMLFLYHTDGSVKGVQDFPILQALTHDVENPYVLVSARKDDSLTKVYSDDSFDNYEDIRSRVINTYGKDLLDAFSINLVAYPNMNVDIGRFCFLDVLDDETNKASRYSQRFLIRTVSHVFQGFRGSTHIELSAPALTYAQQNDVQNLFHL